MTRHLALRCACGLLLLACGGPARDRPPPAPTPASAPTPAPTPAPTDLIQETAEEPPAPDPELTRVLGLTGAASTSTGAPNNGDLAGGVALPLAGPGFRFSPTKEPGSRYGTVELVQALVRAAGVVAAKIPDSEVTYGDLSKQAGGVIPGHASHQAGRDVDVYFYLLGADGTPFPAKAIPIDPDGAGTDYLDLATPDDDIPVKIDVPRTWAFVAALLAEEDAHVQRVFVVEHVRTMLLEHAEAIGAERAIVDRFADITCQPGAPHDDHMHIRVFCTSEDIAAGCRDTKPVYPWHREHLTAAGVKPKMATGRRREAIELKSPAQARAEAGALDVAVEEFLDRRKAWLKKPRTGRPYCR